MARAPEFLVAWVAGTVIEGSKGACAVTNATAE
jgi:hypothetical protein